MNLKPLYDEIYTDIDYGPIATARGFIVSMTMFNDSMVNKKVLCVGSGNAYEAVNFKMHDVDVTTLDFVAPKVDCLRGSQVIGACQEIPFKDNTFDCVLCAECLEHIAPKEIEGCLSELCRVGKATFRYTIADTPDPYRYDSHLCVKGIDWWVEKLEKTGHLVMNAQIKPNFYLILEVLDGLKGIKNWNYGHGYYFRCKKDKDIQKQVS